MKATCACGKTCERGYAKCRKCRNHARLLRRQRDQKIKTQALEAYGGAKCARCGYTGQSLALDHVDTDGATHRKSLGDLRGMSFYRYLRRHNFPQRPQLQVLCLNCNWERYNEKIMERLK